MSSPADLSARLNEARAALLALVRDLTHEALVGRPPASASPDDERWAIRDVLWHVGEVEQGWSRWMGTALAGEPPRGYRARRRPAAMNTLPRLLDWLRETRGETLALLEGLGEAELELLHPTSWSSEWSLAAALTHLVEHDQEHAQQVRDLLR